MHKAGTALSLLPSFGPGYELARKRAHPSHPSNPSARKLDRFRFSFVLGVQIWMIVSEDSASSTASEGSFKDAPQNGGGGIPLRAGVRTRAKSRSSVSPFEYLRAEARPLPLLLREKPELKLWFLSEEVGFEPTVRN